MSAYSSYDNVYMFSGRISRNAPFLLATVIALGACASDDAHTVSAAVSGDSDTAPIGGTTTGATEPTSEGTMMMGSDVCADYAGHAYVCGSSGEELEYQVACRESVCAGLELDGQECADALNLYYSCMAMVSCGSEDVDCAPFAQGLCVPCPSLC